MNGIPSISPKEALEKLKKNEIYLLDVREDNEVKRVKIPGSNHIPMMYIPQKLSNLPHDKQIVVLCHHGSRSARVTMYLLNQGFENVKNIDGGIDRWAKEIDPLLPRY